MKRDLDLCRKILFAIESSVDGETNSIKLPRQDYDPIHLNNNIRLLSEGKLIHAVQGGHSLRGHPALMPLSLTWAGCEFLAAVSNDAVWEKLKAHEQEAGAELPVEILHELALRELRGRVGL